MSLNKYTQCYHLVDEALQLDYKQNNDKAFIYYLKSISAIADTVIDDTGRLVFPSEQHVQSKSLLKVAKQCLDRAEELGEILAKGKADDKCLRDDGILKTSSHECDIPFNDECNNQYSSALLPDIKIHQKSSESILDLSVTSFDRMTSANIDAYMPRPTRISPLEQVERENRQLMAAYKARLARTSTTNAKVNLQLALERRLAENVVLAKTKEQVIKRREQENQKRLLEQAARKIGCVNSINSKEDENTKHIYARILQYEQEKQWPSLAKSKLKAKPLDFTHIDVIIKQTLSAPDHPISELMQKLQYTIYDKIIHLISRSSCNRHNFSITKTAENKSEVDYLQVLDDVDNCQSINRLLLDRSESILEGTLPDVLSINFTSAENYRGDNTEHDSSFEVFNKESKKINDRVKHGKAKSVKCEQLEQLQEDALQRHIHYIVIDVRYSLDKLLNLLLLTYEQLNSAEGRDQCYASMEEPFFKPLWPYLIQLFRLAYRSEELNTAQVMNRYSNKTLQDFKVAQNFCNNDSTKAYDEAVAELKNIINYCCPLKKLEALASNSVRVAHLVCRQDNDPSVEKSIGADDLIPILCFVVLKTRLPQLISECHAMEQFIHEGYLMGEEGYCLTTVQTVFQYLKSLLAEV